MSEPSVPIDASEPGRVARMLSAELFCDTCGRSTAHRVLRIDPVAARAGGRVRGIARCRECRWTHPFDAAVPASVEVTQILSVGNQSERSRISLPTGEPVRVGSRLPGGPEPFEVRRIDGRDGAPRAVARSEEIATVWVTRDVGAVVHVSIVEGRTTRTARLVTPADTPVEVGDRLSVEGVRIEIVALRARGRTWRRPGDRFAAREVQRLYGRRTESPPAGSRDWTRDRGRPRPSASSTSIRARSRSSPGTSRTRTVPRTRRALGGAHVHRGSPS